MIFIGTDIVQISALAEQLSIPGSTFENVFSSRELRLAQQKPTMQRAEHLAGRWAAKEAFIKAWSMSFYGQASPIARDEVKWPEIEIIADTWGRPSIFLQGHIAHIFSHINPKGSQDLAEIKTDKHLSLSISHDGDYALAQVLLEILNIA
ncbi:holo-ACP synthase [Corynebacterium caspium]|uniref:holo-ACP synthase AcpS n=1 Tax=Corynebacterium caspium TaxID=234828 RepID=UPI000380087F|nr:holo-ACP synthase [Corynebacterium caspium]WKD58803.1 Holo-[acyl-carrier-protein] synthase [Corynebacterium caspium DSM 44850]